MRRVLAFFLLMCIFCFCGCGRAVRNDLSFRQKSFSAEVCGELRGRSFSAVVAVDTAGECLRIGVRYLSPKAWEGMELTAWCDANGAPTGLVTVTFDACETEADAAAVAGLLLPASAFFVPEEIERVQKVGEEYRFVLRDGTELTLDGAGAPRSLRAAAVTLEVVWIEWAQTMDRTSLRCVEK